MPERRPDNSGINSGLTRIRGNNGEHRRNLSFAASGKSDKRNDVYIKKARAMKEIS